MTEDNKNPKDATMESFGTKWNNEPSITDLKQDFESSRSNHDAQITKIDTWLNNLHIKSEEPSKSNNPFGSATRSKPKKGKSTINPKLIRKQAEWRYTSLSEPFLNTPDIFKVDPVTWEDAKAAKQNGLVLNNQFNTKLDKVNFIDEYVRTCVNEGTVIVKLGWVYNTEVQPVEYPKYNLIMLQEGDPNIEKLKAAMQTPPEQLPTEVLSAIRLSNEVGIPHWVEQTGVDIVEEEVTVKNHPTVEVCEYNNVHIDPSCKGDISKANFIVYSFETSKSELEKDGRYSNLDSITANTGSVLGDPDHESDYANSGFAFKDEPRKKMIAYEYWGYWDIDGSGIVKPIVATWIGNTLIRLEANPFPDQELPFVVVPYLPVKKSLYGEPDGELLIDNQRVVGAVTRGMIDVMARSANGQIGIRKDALDVVNRRKYESGADYEFNPNVDPRQAVINHVYPELPNSAFQMIMHENNEAESISGIKSFNDGITGAGLGDTAAAAQGALGAAARRELGILRRLAEGLKKVGHKIIAMNQQFLSEEEVVRVTNEEFETIRRDDLAGHFDLRLSISTAEADEQKAKELSFMLQTTGQQFGLEMYQLILAEIADLRKMPELSNKIKQYSPQPSEFEQQTQQIELERLQLENEKTKAEIAKLYADAGKAQADSGSKAADTDRKNLDYVQEESGVNQERELEKGKAQARGNMELELLKSQINPKPVKETTN